MKVDTTLSPSEYVLAFRKIYYRNYIELRKQFTNWLDKIGDKKNFNWWLSIPASRNLNLSKLYHYFCIVESIKSIKKVDRENINEFIIDNEHLREILNKQLKCNFLITLRRERKEFLIIKFYQIIKHFFFYTIIFLFSKIFNSQQLNKEKKYIFIDTFLDGNDLNRNRYYGDKLLEIVKKKNNVLFLPSFFIGMGLINVLKKIFQCSFNDSYLVKESYLKLGDIFKSFLYSNKNEYQNKKYLKLNNVDYSKIIYEELKSYKNLAGQISGWQNYLFFKNLKLKNISLKKTINWFENQSLEKGWNFGVQTFFPKTLCYGYQGFTYFPQYMCLNPSTLEYDLKIVPNTILTIGKRFENTKKEFCKKIKVKTAPALSFQYLHKRKKNKSNKIQDSILIILSGFLNDDVNLIRWIIKSKLHKENYKISIKEHPILKINKIKDIISDLPKNFKLTKSNFTDAVDLHQILICTGATSALTELVIQGKYCIIPRINPFDGISLKKVGMSKNFNIVEKPEELINSLKIKNCKKYRINQFFNKLTKKNLEVFFN